MDFRLVLALWAVTFLPLVGFIVLGKGVDRGLLWSIRFGIALLLFTPFVITTDTFFPFVVGKALATRGLIEIVFGLYVLLAIRRQEFRPRHSLIVLAFAAFLVGNLIAAIAGVSFTRSFWSNFERMQGVFDLAHWFALLAVLISVVRGNRQWMTVINALVGVGLVIGLLGIAQRLELKVFPFLDSGQRLTITLGNATYVGAVSAMIGLLALGLLVSSFHTVESATPSDKNPGHRRGNARRRVAPAKSKRLSIGADPVSAWLKGLSESPERKVIWPVAYLCIWGLFVPSVASGMSASVAFVGAAVASLIVASLWAIGRERAIWGGVAVLSLWVLLESGSRGSGLALVAGLTTASTAYFFWGPYRPLRIAGLAASGLIITIGLLVVLAGDFGPIQSLANTNQLTRRAASAGSQILDAPRRVSSRIALEGFLERPVTGWGPENFAVLFRKFQRPSDFASPPENQDQTHNRPLEVLSTTGVVGFLPFVILWASVAWLGVHRVRASSPAPVFAIFMLAASFTYFVHSLFLFETASTMVLLTLFAAYAAGGQKSAGAAPIINDLPPPLPSSDPSRKWIGYSRNQNIYLIGLVVVSVALGLAFILIHRPTQRAAFLITRPVQLEHIAANLATFPPLATLPRLVLIEVAESRLLQFAPNEQAFLIEVLGKEIRSSQNAEPSNVQIWLAASRFYAAAAQIHRSYIPQARAATDEALRLGPHMHETHARAVEQAFLERDLAAVRSAIKVWKTEHPDQDIEQINRYDERANALADELGRSESGG